MSGGGNEWILILIQIMDQNRLKLFLWNSKNISDSQDWEKLLSKQKRKLLYDDLKMTKMFICVKNKTISGNLNVSLYLAIVVY